MVFRGVRKFGARSAGSLPGSGQRQKSSAERPMPDLNFHIDRANAVSFAAVPTIAFELTVKNADAGVAIHSVILHSQIQIEVTRRHYAAEEQQRLRDLFDEPGRWRQTLRSLLWTHCNVNVPAFEFATVVE